MSDIEAIAHELAQRATQVEIAGDQLVQAAAEAIWTSIAADAFRAQVAGRRRECDHVADVLRAAARDVLRFADGVGAEKARLRRLELAAEHAAHAAQMAGAGVARAAGFIGRL